MMKAYEKDTVNFQIPDLGQNEGFYYGPVVTGHATRDVETMIEYECKWMNDPQYWHSGEVGVRERRGNKETIPCYGRKRVKIGTSLGYHFVPHYHVQECGDFPVMIRGAHLGRIKSKSNYVIQTHTEDVHEVMNGTIE